MASVVSPQVGKQAVTIASLGRIGMQVWQSVRFAVLDAIKTTVGQVIVLTVMMSSVVRSVNEVQQVHPTVLVARASSSEKVPASPVLRVYFVLAVTLCHCRQQVTLQELWIRTSDCFLSIAAVTVINVLKVQFLPVQPVEVDLRAVNVRMAIRKVTTAPANHAPLSTAALSGS